MSRSGALRIVAVLLLGYGAYRALFIPAMLVGPPAPLLSICVILEARLGIVAGLGVGLGARWSPLLVILLGVSIAVTALVEGFVLGIVAYLRALLEAAVAIVVAVLIAGYVRDRVGASIPTATR